MGYSPWDRKESDTTERLHLLSFSLPECLHSAAAEDSRSEGEGGRQRSLDHAVSGWGLCWYDCPTMDSAAGTKPASNHPCTAQFTGFLGGCRPLAGGRGDAGNEGLDADVDRDAVT